ncbi:hypothetical protein E2C01_048279 [Portunus trituberculatus]|uniref:Uncharacterized protein n=1 Tax=Portunus trituberculatus TaxID=210409 RepID=A0A5B7GB51_PORTR|nr:hypothetical protein [Portunus trituberculatus]
MRALLHPRPTNQEAPLLKREDLRLILGCVNKAGGPPHSSSRPAARSTTIRSPAHRAATPGKDLPEGGLSVPLRGPASPAP